MLKLASKTPWMLKPLLMTLVPSLIWPNVTLTFAVAAPQLLTEAALLGETVRKVLSRCRPLLVLPTIGAVFSREILAGRERAVKGRKRC